LAYGSQAPEQKELHMSHLRSQETKGEKKKGHDFTVRKDPYDAVSRGKSASAGNGHEEKSKGKEGKCLFLGKFKALIIRTVKQKKRPLIGPRRHKRSKKKKKPNPIRPRAASGSPPSS